MTFSFNESKFKELILYVAQRSESDPSFGAIKLNKVLFLADILAYAMLNRPITGAEYFKLERGPAPRLMLPVREAMIRDNDIVMITRESFGLPHDRIIAKRPPDLSEFTGHEIALVNDVIELEKDASGSDLSEMTHRMVGWRVAAHKEVIPYSTVFLSEDPLTEDDYLRAQELAARYEW